MKLMAERTVFQQSVARVQRRSGIFATARPAALWDSSDARHNDRARWHRASDA